MAENYREKNEILVSEFSTQLLNHLSRRQGEFRKLPNGAQFAFGNAREKGQRPKE